MNDKNVRLLTQLIRIVVYNNMFIKIYENVQVKKLSRKMKR